MSMKTHPATDVVPLVVLDDRRRPGRSADASPELIELLRGSTSGEPVPPVENDVTSPLAASRGIKVAVMLSAPIWVLALVLVAWLLR